MKIRKANVCLKAGILLLAAMLLTGCNEAQEKNKIRIGYFPNITHSQALLMREQGRLEESLGEEYEVEWKAFNAGPAEVEALFAGELDIGFIGPGPAISAYTRSEGDFVIVAGVAEGGTVLLAGADTGIVEAADLDGKRVAVPQLGNTQHLQLLELLEKNHLAPASEGGSVDIVASANADIMNLMEQGRIDAALVPEPWGSLMEANGSAKAVTKGEGIEALSSGSVAVMIASKEYVEKNETAINAFLDSYEAATELLVTERETAKQLVSQRISEETGKAIEENILETAMQRINFTTEVSEQSLKNYAQILYEQQFIPQLPDEQMLCYTKK